MRKVLLSETKSRTTAAAERAESHYFNVLRGVTLPRYQLAKTVAVRMDTAIGEIDSNALWDHHDQLVAQLKAMDPLHVNDRVPVVGKYSLMDIKCELGRRMLKDCHLCENHCGNDRTEGNVGKCGVESVPRIHNIFPHYGEEAELVPSHTVFFTGCNFLCVHCQNFDISQSPESGRVYSLGEIVDILYNRDKQCVNMNWVGGDPTPNIPYILEVLNEMPFDMQQPSVWNSNMYHSEVASRLLDFTQDLYLGDLKYGNDKCARQISKRRKYTETVQSNFKRAMGQGASILVRHLVLPNHIDCCTVPAMNWIAADLGVNTRVNVMFQYRPEYMASDIEEIDRVLSRDECRRALRAATDAGLTNAFEM